jgi:hypothetical protein
VATAITGARLVKEFRRDPLRLGYHTTTGTVPLLATHLSQRYHCRIPARPLRRMDEQAEYAERWGLGLSRREVLCKAGVLSKNFWLEDFLRNFWQPT